MAFDTSVGSIFRNPANSVGVTVSNGNVVLPSGSIVSFSTDESAPSTNNGTSELVYGLLQTLANTVESGAMTHMTVSKRDTINGNILRKDFTFRVDLSYDGSTVGGLLDVAAEPTAE